MRKLTLDEITFGLVEGQTYEIRNKYGGLYTKGAFLGYNINCYDALVIELKTSRWQLLDIKTNEYNTSNTKDGYYFTTED
jgi:hypothetical protein